MCKYTYIHVTFIYMYILYILYRYTYTHVCASENSLSLLCFYRSAKCLNFEQNLQSPSLRKQTSCRNCDVSL